MKGNIIDYLVASSTSPRGLQNSVKEYLRDGWQLQGGLAVCFVDKETRTYYQALVRYERPS